MNDEKKDEEIQGITGIKLDDHEKQVEANIKMEEKLGKKEVPKGVKEHIAEHARYLQRRKPQLPKKLIILSVEWDIIYFDKQIEVDEDKEEHLFGQVVFENNTIRVFKGKRKIENIFETIFHEWTHIILVQLDYRWAFTRTDEERFVHALSSALNDLFWRNLNVR